jgi:hypothetical protein
MSPGEHPAYHGLPGRAKPISAKLDVEIVVSPNVLDLESNGVWVTVHAEIPYASVVGVSVQLGGIPVEIVKADSRGVLVARFLLDDVNAILTPAPKVLTLTGATKEGGVFSGADEILVIEQTGRR